HRVLGARPGVVAAPRRGHVGLEPRASLVGEGQVARGEGEIHAAAYYVHPPSSNHVALGGRRASVSGEGMPNDRLYLHEIIHIVGTGSEAYKQHTGTRVPSGPAGGLVGTWQQSGSTGDWPQVVNLWEMPGWD